MRKNRKCIDSVINSNRLYHLAILLAFCSIQINGLCQSTESGGKYIDIGMAIGKAKGSLEIMLNYDKALGKNGKIVIGFGGRFTAYAGKNQYFVTAPAKLTSGSKGPGVIFKENIEANMDSFLVKHPQINSVNLFLTLGYNPSKRLALRFNIDLLGFSFGKRVAGTYINGSQSAMVSASPTPFNLLLVSDNDKGSLNSELFARYWLNEKWGIKGGLQFLFSEYTTDEKVQQFPEPNDRFRNKSLTFGAGISYKL